MIRTGVFVSSMSWRDYETAGFRTRRGAVLKAFVRCERLNHFLLFVATGWRGLSGMEEIWVNGGRTRIVQISVPGRFPEKPLRLLSPSQVSHNYRLPPQAADLLKDESPLFIWTYWAGLGELIRRQSSAPLLYDVIDYLPTHLNLSSLGNVLWQRELLAGCGYADIVVCNGEPAFNALQKHAKRCVLIRNGIDSEYLVGSGAQLARQGIGFVGTLSNWIDFDLIEFLLQGLPSVSFEFHGMVLTNASRLERLERYPNFHWHGPLLPRDVISSFTRYQVALVPYNPNFTMASIGDSMKVFEYLAAGTPVVSTDFQPHLKAKFADLIHVCRDRTQFLESVKLLLQQPSDPVWQERARKFVLANTWEHRLDEVFHVLQRLD